MQFEIFFIFGQVRHSLFAESLPGQILNGDNRAAYIFDVVENGYMKGRYDEWLAGHQQIDPKTNSLFERAFNWVFPRDPLAIDLDGDGIETVGIDAAVLFDHDGQWSSKYPKINFGLVFPTIANANFASNHETSACIARLLCR